MLTSPAREATAGPRTTGIRGPAEVPTRDH
jgi:hypothetical protein